MGNWYAIEQLLLIGKSYRYTEVEDATEFFIPDSFVEANEKARFIG